MTILLAADAGLRHRFGTWLADMGASPKAIRDLMGHRHLATTEGSGEGGPSSRKSRQVNNLEARAIW